MLPSRVRGASDSRVATTSNTVVLTTSAPIAAQNHHFWVSDGGSPRPAAQWLAHRVHRLDRLSLAGER